MAGWIGISSFHYDSHSGDDGIKTVEEALDGTDYWGQGVDETHWVILDLGQSYNVTKVRGRSYSSQDPVNVNVYVSDSKVSWGAAVASGISTWQDTTAWVEIDTTDKIGRYIKIEITDTERDPENYMSFGRVAGAPFSILDVYEDGDVTITPSTLALISAIKALTFTSVCTVTISALTLELAVIAPGILPSIIVTPSVLALTSAIIAPTTLPSIIVTPSVLTLELIVQAPDVIIDVIITPSTLALTSAIIAPTILSSIVITPSVLTLELTDQTPSVIVDCTITPSTLALTSAIGVPTILSSIVITPSVLTLELTGQTPVVIIDVVVTPSALTLELTGQDIIVSVYDVITIDGKVAFDDADWEGGSTAYNLLIKPNTDGTPESKKITGVAVSSVEGGTFDITVESAFAIVPTTGDVWAIGVAEYETKEYRIVNLRQNSEQRVEITALEYVEDIYEND